MPLNDMSFRIGGEAGQGLESSGAGLAKALTRAGLYVHGVPDAHSRIRGGHNFFTIRVSSRPLGAIQDTIEVLMALDAQTVRQHIHSLVPGAAMIIDEGITFDENLLVGRDIFMVRVPIVKIAQERGGALMANTAMLAIAAGLTGFDLTFILGVVEDSFRSKGTKVVEANRQVAQAAYNLAKSRFGESFPWKLAPIPSPQRLTMSGNHAFAIGALMGGCKFVAGYPMTPATPVLEYMAQHAADWGLVVKHAESEVAAINMVVGAGHAGVRAMAPTSGGGFDLMTEGLSLAAMTETPVVIYLGQRPGPATGLPTRSCQGDLFLAMHASHGEFTRIILAPHNAKELFGCAIRAFNLAEKYQCPVYILSDHELAGAIESVDISDSDLHHIAIDRGKLLSPEQVDAMPEYKRYALTDDGISPRALPGSSPKAVYLVTGDEHTEEGHITEAPEIVVAMADKRLRKGQIALQEMRSPYREGPAEADVTLVCWGSTRGPVQEAMELLNGGGQHTANLVHFVDLWPFPKASAIAALAQAQRVVVVEGNAQAQFASIVECLTGITIQQRILKYDGIAWR
jgi:2-oxoglutarate ferredoxin oxidoreductase subunit alpha